MPYVLPALAAAGVGPVTGLTGFWLAAAQFAVAAVVSSAVNKPKGFNAENRGTQVVLRSAIEGQRVIYGETVCSGPLVYSRVSRDSVRAYERHRVPVSPFQVTAWFASEYRQTIFVMTVTTSGDVTEGILETFGLLMEGVDYTVVDGLYTFAPGLAGADIQIIYEHGAFEAANSWLHLVIPLAGHEVQAIGDVFFNSDVIADSDLDAEGNVVSGKYTGFAKIRKHLGAPGQAADGYLISVSNGQWTSQHVGEGIAYIVVSLRRNQNLYTAGVPNIRAKVKGAKLYDPRTASTAWSDNWALVVRDYLSREDGFNCADEEIDDTLLIAAANVSDEDVDLDEVPTTQKRYTADGIVSLDRQPLEVLKELLSAGAGNAVYSVSSWAVYAGAYVAPTRTLTVSDLRDEVAGAPDLPRRDIFNAVRGTFVNPDADWQQTSFPPVENPTYAGEDGETIFRDVEFPFCKNAIRAQRLAKIVLERARQGATMAWPGKLTCFRVNTWETVNIQFAQLGYTPKAFRCTAWQWQPGDGVDLGLQEEAAAAYDWNFGEATTLDIAPNTSLAGQGPLGQPGAPQVSEELYETRDGRGVGVRAIMAWSRPQDSYVVQYEPEYKLASAGGWIRLLPTTDLTARIDDMAPGIYDFRVRALDDFGRSSGYGQTRKEIKGLTAAPSAPTGLSIQAGGGTARLKFDQSPDLDVRRGGRVLVRFCHETVVTPDWQQSFSIGEPEGWPGDATQVDVPLKPGTYLVKFMDSTGHESATATEFETKQASVLAFTSLQALIFEGDFIGTYSGTANVGGQLSLGGLGLFDDIADLDAVDDLDGFGGIATTGTWTADTGTDLGTVKQVRITGRLEGNVDFLLDTIDERTGEVDSWLDWDGATLDGSAADAWLEVRETDDDPAGAPAWSEWKRVDAAEFEARAFQYRAVLKSFDAAYRPLVTVLRVAVEEVV